MRINDIVNQRLGLPTGAIASDRKRSVAAADNQGEGAAQGQSSRLASPRVTTKVSIAPAETTGARKSDQADISTAAARRAATNRQFPGITKLNTQPLNNGVTSTKGTDANTGTLATDPTSDLATSDETSTDPSTTDSGQSNILGQIVDQYTRQRAALAYTVNLGSAGTLSFTYEIESSTRVISFVQPGQVLDAQA